MEEMNWQTWLSPIRTSWVRRIRIWSREFRTTTASIRNPTTGVFWANYRCNGRKKIDCVGMNGSKCVTRAQWTKLSVTDSNMWSILWLELMILSISANRCILGGFSIWRKVKCELWRVTRFNPGRSDICCQCWQGGHDGINFSAVWWD